LNREILENTWEGRVLIDGNVVAPGTPVGAEAGPDDGWVYCDKRWQQMNQTFSV